MHSAQVKLYASNPSNENIQHLLICKFYEEAGELTSEFLKKIGKATRKPSVDGALEEELADVIITILPFAMHFGASPEKFVSILEAKLQRFENRVRDQEYLQQQSA